jgi:hypothetical protein
LVYLNIVCPNSNKTFVPSWCQFNFWTLFFFFYGPPNGRSPKSMPPRLPLLVYLLIVRVRPSPSIFCSAVILCSKNSCAANITFLQVHSTHNTKMEVDLLPNVFKDKLFDLCRKISWLIRHRICDEPGEINQLN